MLERDIALIDELCSRPAEESCLEFKKDNTDPAVIGKLCSALANTARIDGKDLAYVLWGIEDESHVITGSAFNPNTKKIGNQVFQLWLAQRLKPSIAFSFRMVEHPAGQVIILEIPAATTAPVEFEGTAYVRIGSATPKLSDYPDRFQKLIDNIRPYTWEKGVAAGFLPEDKVLELLDYPAYFTLTDQRLPDNRAGIFEHLNADRLITKDVGEYWNITNMGALLFAKHLDRFDSSLARKGVRFIAYDGDNRAANVIRRQDGEKGYAAGFESLLDFINNLLPQNEHIGTAFRESQPLFPGIAIRELIANALIHQDLTISGTGPQIELFADRIEITNPGHPLVQIDRMIDLPPRSRNEMLASLMRRMGICEEQGSGLDKVIIHVELFQLPAPKFQADGDSTQVILYSPRSFANMTLTERVRACYQHAVITYLSGKRMKNASLCKRFGIQSKNAAQASQVIKVALQEEKIKPADPEHPRAGYIPWWA
jgi:predicted HTH transcriptional regulator